MPILSFAITALRPNRHPLGIANPARDFECTAVASPTQLPSTRTSLYGLDPQRRTAAFVETSDPVDGAPFVYQAQRRTATRIHHVAYEDLATLAEARPGCRAVAWLYSVGRCGSTLLARLLSHGSGLTTLSEPDVFTQLSNLPIDFGARDRPAILRQLTRLLLPGATASPTRPILIKLRSDVLRICDELAQLRPNAWSIFLHRDPLDVIASFDRMHGHPHQRLGASPAARAQLAERSAERIAWADPLLDGLRARQLVAECGHAGLFALDWLSKMERWARFATAGARVASLRYEDLVARPLATVRALCLRCELPEPAAADIHDELARDSQAGTPLASSDQPRVGLSDDDRQRLSRILREHTRWGPDAIIPGALG